MKLILSSHGLKTGPLPKADLYLDCRVLPDNVTEEVLEDISTLAINRFFRTITTEFMNTLPSRKKVKIIIPQATICFICAWGINRSVNAKNIIARWLRESTDFEVEVR